MVYLQGLRTLTIHAAILIPIQNMLPFGFPPRIEQGGAIRAVGVGLINVFVLEIAFHCDCKNFAVKLIQGELGSLRETALTAFI